MILPLAQCLRSICHQAFLALAVLALLLTPLRLVCYDGCDSSNAEVMTAQSNSGVSNDQGNPSNHKDTDGCGHCHCPVLVALVAPHPMVPSVIALVARQGHVLADDNCVGFAPSPDPFPDRA